MLKKQREGKDSSLENLRQYVIKILLNSGYGAFVNKYFRWYDQRIGKSITLSGQLIIQVAEREINKWMNKVMQTTDVDYIIAIDTDSNYLNCQPLVDKFFKNKSTEEVVDILDKIAKDQIQSVLESGFQVEKEYLNAMDQDGHGKRSDCVFCFLDC
jgi:DNA polymerase elongation subunit (family B)